MNNIEAANLALRRAGNGAAYRIENLETDDTEAAAVVRDLFQATLQPLLEEFPWPFARAVVALAESSADAPPGWTYAYAPPSNARSIRYVADNGFVPDWVSLIECVPRWEVMAHPTENGLILVTDVPEAYAWYTKEITEVAFTNATFADLFAWRLTREVALGLKADANLSLRAERAYEKQLDIAVARAFNERGGQRPIEAASILARGGGYYTDDPYLLRPAVG